MKKRYAIVRVDNTWCPNKFENVDNRFVCDSRKKNIKYVHCERCLYGDTKEQLIAKIITILKREKKGWFHISEREIANKIVEFLGVEE